MVYLSSLEVCESCDLASSFTRRRAPIVAGNVAVPGSLGSNCSTHQFRSKVLIEAAYNYNEVFHQLC
ncbi:uncharacterized protein LY79DRAFT_557075 [Colletotrichum navitas]|uniref:Uncharacterized protein n=1 Tax=Colletotrichum navitas TaxID=681940 RepID=A0AAD8V3R7_9PEZI|nr:uncharacterized protein LY79DRAFT_557075 [Colletotrichum navitas]KAK1586178.1 hypothetical protein LY79DRAFT_557075 [Colletotrichum navitas]